VVTTLYSLDAEFSKPMWIFGVSSYDFLGKDDSSYKIICCYRQNGKSYVGVLDHDSDSFSKVDIPFSSVNNIVSGDGSFYIEGASASLPVSIAKVDLQMKHGGSWILLCSTGQAEDGHLLMLTMGEAQRLYSAFAVATKNIC